MLQLILPMDMLVIALLKIFSILINLLKNLTLITAYFFIKNLCITGNGFTFLMLFLEHW